tara:strand:- start:215 stop:547 length:333 start_codon:yes stop_codon:yes gene_type:complete
MAHSSKDSSSSKTAEGVTSAFIVTFTDGTTPPVSIANPTYRVDDEYYCIVEVSSKWKDTTNTLAEAMELAADFLDDLRKDKDLSEEAECVIFQRVTGTRGRTTQTVHLLS